MTSKETLKKFRTKLNAKLKKGLPKKLKSQLKTTKLGRTAKATVQMASNLATTFRTEGAKHSLDQVFLNLEHRGLSIKESQDLAIKVGRRVLERAESFRAQIAENPLSPAWLKEVRLKCADKVVMKVDESLATDALAVNPVFDEENEIVAKTTLKAKRSSAGSRAGSRKGNGASPRASK